MIIVIDGYNLLKQRDPGEFISDKQREYFIRELGEYTQKKKHKITVVFDGGPYEWPHKERHIGVNVIYSGVHETADEYIMAFLEKRSTSDILLVSSDHELGLFADEIDVPTINALDFYALLKEALVHKEPAVEHHEVVKITQAISDDIDSLMKEASKNIDIKAEDVVRPIRYPHKKDKMSRRERKLLAKLRKL